MTRLPKWDGHSRPPTSHRAVHRLIGPPVAFVVAAADALKEARQTFARSYRQLRSWHADKWQAPADER